jgi:hypothetical protein
LVTAKCGVFGFVRTVFSQKLDFTKSTHGGVYWGKRGKMSDFSSQTAFKTKGKRGWKKFLWGGKENIAF